MVVVVSLVPGFIDVEDWPWDMMFQQQSRLLVPSRSARMKESTLLYEAGLEVEHQTIIIRF